VSIRPEDAERFIEEVRGDDPEVAASLRIEGARVGCGRVELTRKIQFELTVV